MIEVSIPKIKDENEIKERVKEMSTDRLLAICNDIYKFKYIEGVLAEDCEFRSFAEELGFKNFRTLEEIYIIPEAFERFKNMIPLLMLNNNYGIRFMRLFKED